MSYLIDTNILIWFLTADPQLPIQINRVIEDEENTIFFSIASLWEITIKASLGKLKIPASLQEIYTDITDSNGFRLMPIKINHLQLLAKLPWYHRDPFDRLIFAQARADGLQLLYTDEIFDQYNRLK